MLTFGYPVLWLIGIAGFYWVFLGIAGIVYLAIRRRPHAMTYPAIIVMAALLLSMPVGVVAFGLDFSRVASFFGNLLVWIALVALITLAFDRDIVNTIKRSVLVIGVAQGLVTFAASRAYPSTLPIPLLSGLADKLPSGPAAFAMNNLYGMDWLGGAAPRSAGMMAQPTWGGIFGAITCIVAVSVLFRATGDRPWLWRIIAVAGLASGLYNLDLSLSRSTELCLVAAIGIGLIVAIRKYSHVLFGVVSAVAALVVAFLVIGWSSQIAVLAGDINDARVGSLDARSAIYARTWELFTQLPFPLLGYGIKPKDSALVASVATHSSYLGMLFRAGIVGVLAFAALFLVAFFFAVRYSDGLAATLIALGGLWCGLEDFDPGHLLPIGVALGFALLARHWRAGPAPAIAPPATTRSVRSTSSV